jgi:hypothetical protein
VRASSSGNLNGFLAGWQQEWADSGHQTDRGLGPPFTDLVSVIVTDEGRFEITGAGKERLTLVQLSGPHIAQAILFVVGRRNIDTTPINEAADRLTRPEHRIPGQPPLLVAATFEYIAQPTKVVLGRVREAETGMPVPRVNVSGTGGYNNSVESITDTDGRFKLVGLQKLKEYSLHAWPRGDSPMLHRSLRVPDTAGLAPIEVDIELPRGVVVTGRIIDKATGKGVPGGVRFAPLVDNKYFGTKPGYDSYRYERVMTGTDRDGRFRLVTMPGTGVLIAQVIENDRRLDGRGVIIYKEAELSPEERARLTLTEDGRYFIAAGQVLESVRVDHAAKVVDLQLHGEEVVSDFLVDPGVTKEVRVEGPDGKPLTGTTVAGVTAAWPITFTIEDSQFTAYALDPQKPRQILAYHAQQKLAGRLMIRGDETEVPTVRLTAARSLTGRALDPSGVPLADAEVRINFDGETAYELRRYLNQHREINRTSSDGTFRIEGLMPQCGFELYFRQGQSAFEAEGVWKRVSAILTSDSSRADAIDLGEVKVKQLR